MSAALLATIAEARMRVSAATLQLALRHTHWRTQPRVPAGNGRTSGQWTDGGSTGGGAVGGGIVRLVQAEASQGFSVDLQEEETAGGHAIRSHVGRSPESLLARVRGERYFGFIFEIRRKRDGSFPSVQAANKLVNATLARNRAIVEKVARGALRKAFVTAEFSSKTGIEAYGERGTPRLRDTYGVGATIVHDPNSTRGFRVITAYPRND